MLHSVILGIIQGLTEFLPISSSGHLLVIPYLFDWGESGLAFDVALNTGTFLAVLVYFAPTYWKLVVEGLIRRQKAELGLIGLLVLATLPAAAFGYWGEAFITDTLRQPLVAAVMLIVFGLILGYAEKVATNTRDMGHIGWKTALLVGVAQALALVPGVSRSGITMTAGLLAGMKKSEAARFSFLLVAPISFGAAIVEAPNVLAASNTTEMAIGTLVSFLVGLAAIHLLLKWVTKYGFKPYVWYRVIAGLVFLLLVVRP